MSTPAQELGFQIGDLFRYDTKGEVNDPQFSDGSVIRFCRDDGSSMPEFELVTGSCVWNDNKAYLFIQGQGHEYLNKIDEATEAPAQEESNVVPIDAAIRSVFLPSTDGQTHCEKLGYKVGDHFVVGSGTGLFRVGQTVKLVHDDGTIAPKFEVVTGPGCMFGNWGFDYIERMQKVDQETAQPEQEAGVNESKEQEAVQPTSVEQKRDRVVVIVGEIGALQAEKEKLIQEIKDAGFTVIGLEEAASKPPAVVSLTHPQTWPAGSVVKCVTDKGGYPAAIKVGQEYQIGIDAAGDRYIIDDDGDEMFVCVARGCFEFVRHP